VPKYRNIITSPHSIFSGFRKSGFRDLRVQGNSPLDIPDAETPKYGFSYTLSFRDFACRDFGTCEYKGTRPWVFRVETLKYQLLNLLAFRGDFGTCEYKGTRPWIFRMPKHRNVEVKKDHSLSCRVLRLTP
jgi:hypothetical protein